MKILKKLFKKVKDNISFPVALYLTGALILATSSTLLLVHKNEGKISITNNTPAHIESSDRNSADKDDKPKEATTSPAQDSNSATTNTIQQTQAQKTQAELNAKIKEQEDLRRCIQASNYADPIYTGRRDSALAELKIRTSGVYNDQRLNLSQIESINAYFTKIANAKISEAYNAYTTYKTQQNCDLGGYTSVILKYVDDTAADLLTNYPYLADYPYIN